MRRLTTGLLVALLLPATVLAADPATVLPGPERLGRGEVPVSEPLFAPVPRDPAWTITMYSGAGLANAFHSKVAFTAGFRRAFGRWSLGGYAGRAFPWSNPALELCSSPGNCQTPGAARLAATPGRLDWMGGAGVGLRAAEGKLSLGGLGLSHFRLDATADASAVGYELDDGGNSSRWAPGLRLGVAASAEIARGWSLGLDLSSLLYVPTVRGVTAVEQQLFLGLGLGFRPGGGR